MCTHIHVCAHTHMRQAELHSQQAEVMYRKISHLKYLHHHHHSWGKFCY